MELAKEFAEAEAKCLRAKKTRIELLQEQTTGECGRGKYRNIFIYGDTNCGKSFILAPLKVIYKTFCNPATGSFAWLGAEDAEVIFLNDFRWHPKIIAWADFLQALEGDTVHLPTPKKRM
ncbi:unnamed protein product [Porites lobata]|uniref:Replication associated protein n=1 Tax=Porites lobata TaxID=104759 RepID=A0ABN8S5Y3_9CNID|nr:unnamed protein product [Porites lobata]